MKRTVLITAGTSDIGKAISKKLAKEGFEIIITYFNSEEKALSLAQDLKKDFKISVFAIKADLRDLNTISSVYEKIKEKFEITDLINNAGASNTKDFISMEKEEIINSVNMNLVSTMLLSQLCLADMIKRKFGNIINLSSEAGRFGGTNMATYAASKAGINIFTRAIAKEVGQFNIRVNAISPGIIDTNMNSKALSTPEILKNIISNIPLRRIGTPEDIANLAYFLLSEESFYINGEAISISGGR